MAGKLPPETEYPVPEIESELIVTAAVPLEVTVTDFVTAVPTETLPNASEVALSPSAGIAAFSCTVTLCDDPFALAAIVAACKVVTEATVAANDAVARPEATVTLAGTVTALSLLATATFTPPDGAAELSDTVHVVVPAPVKELLPQDNALIDGADVDADPPNAIDVVFATDPCVAVSATDCDAVTADTFAVKLALMAPDGTETEAGTVTALLLLARLTVTFLFESSALSVTVQESVPAPIIDDFAQLSSVSEGTVEAEPWPCSLTAPARFTDVPVFASTLSWPVESAVDPGS